MCMWHKAGGKIGVLLHFLLTGIPAFLSAQEKPVVLTGGTVIDVDNYGKSENDIEQAVVVIEKGIITAVGKKGAIRIPAEAKIIDVSGKYIVPGLIDGFATLNNQAYANAFLYTGVTTAVMVDGQRRGDICWDASPSPAKIKFDSYWGADGEQDESGKLVSTNHRNEAQIRHEIDSLAKNGVKVLLLHYGVKNEQLPAIVAACKKNHIVTIGELGLASYKAAVKAGVQGFVHTTRYAADMLPESARKEYAVAPFGPPARYFYRYLMLQQQNLPGDQRLKELSVLYGNAAAGLMPTASMMIYPALPFAKNSWKEPAASIIDVKDIDHRPLDKQTGKHTDAAPSFDTIARLVVEIDRMFVKAGAKYVTGSGSDAFGAIPGVSLHAELAMLSHFGLSNREALAAATNNFSLLWDWKHIGKIEKGREADILVLNADPLESVNNLQSIELLILDGTIINRKQLLEK